MTRVYLAGKMAVEREQECSCDVASLDTRHFPMPAHDDDCPSWQPKRTHWREALGVERLADGQECQLSGGFIFGGPWFIDPGSHGEDRHHVPTRCFGWIQRSDAVFAWLGTGDAHGTLLEIGYAKAFGKPLFIAIDTSDGGALRRDLWFAEQVSDGFAALPSVGDAWTMFRRWWRAGRAAQVPGYGLRVR